MIKVKVMLAISNVKSIYRFTSIDLLFQHGQDSSWTGDGCRAPQWSREREGWGLDRVVVGACQCLMVDMLSRLHKF